MTRRLSAPSPSAPSQRSRPSLITSRDNEKLKLVRKLQERRWRDKLGLFVAEGEDLVDAARAAGYEAEAVLVSGEDVQPELLAEVSTLGHPPRVIGVFRRRETAATADTTLALWRVSDPGNVGTLLRSADAFGAGVMLSEGCADPFGPKALRAAMGSTFRVPLLAFDVPPGSVALVAAGGEPLDTLDLDRYSTFVVGAEREGLPKEVLARCNVKATIPTSQVESLNVAMAGTIVLYERRRKLGSDPSGVRPR
jgi:TrmH family RNA methyltransferase